MEWIQSLIFPYEDKIFFMYVLAHSSFLFCKPMDHILHCFNIIIIVFFFFL